MSFPRHSLSKLSSAVMSCLRLEIVLLQEEWSFSPCVTSTRRIAVERLFWRGCLLIRVRGTSCFVITTIYNDDLTVPINVRHWKSTENGDKAWRKKVNVRSLCNSWFVSVERLKDEHRFGNEGRGKGDKNAGGKILDSRTNIDGICCICWEVCSTSVLSRSRPFLSRRGENIFISILLIIVNFVLFVSSQKLCWLVWVVVELFSLFFSSGIHRQFIEVIRQVRLVLYSEFIP